MAIDVDSLVSELLYNYYDGNVPEQIGYDEIAELLFEFLERNRDSLSKEDKEEIISTILDYDSNGEFLFLVREKFPEFYPLEEMIEDLNKRAGGLSCFFLSEDIARQEKEKALEYILLNKERFNLLKEENQETRYILSAFSESKEKEKIIDDFFADAENTDVYLLRRFLKDVKELKEEDKNYLKTLIDKKLEQDNDIDF